MKRARITLMIGGLAAGLCSTPVAQAYDLPPLNLGFTSFLDGGPPAGPGFYLTPYLQYYHSSRFNDPNGHDLGLPNTDLNVWASLVQLIYQSDQKVLLGGKWGLDVIQPVVGFDLKHGGPAGSAPLANAAGFGDLLVGPYLQWDPIMGKNGPIFMHRVEFQVLAPTGRYSASRQLNPGSHFLSFDPYWSGTLFLTPKWTTSLRLHYLWNDSNDDPNVPDPRYAGARETQAGQAIHFNFGSEYEVVKNLRLGVNAYYLKQFTADQKDGVDIPGSREEVFGIGPGAMYSFSKNDHLFLNSFIEPVAKNRPEGVRVTLRFVHHF